MFNLRATFAIMMTALLIGAGCTEVPAQAPRQPSAPSTAPARWQAIAPGADRAALDLSATTTMILYRFSPDRYAFGFAGDGSERRVSQWVESRAGTRLAVNGAYFHVDGSPSGFLAIDGERKGARMFDLDKSALVDASSGLRIIDTAREVADLDRVHNGAQSFPLLFSGGEPRISRDSGLKARRTVVGTDTEGRIYVGTVTRGEISLYRLMIALREKIDVSWTDVVNLDGGPSSGLAARFEGWTETADSFTAVPSAFLVFERRDD